MPEYWELERYDNLQAKQMKAMLAERHYEAGSITDKERLKICLQRSDLGLLSYVKYKNNELRDLIKARGIQTDFSKGNKGQRHELIDVLEHADNNREFRNFTRLPAELRTRVYEYYMADFTEPLTAPKQPPLTLASSLTRKEALPIFYSTRTFQVDLLPPLASRFRATNATKLKIHASSLLWMQSTWAENLADIQSLRFRCSPFPERDGRFDWLIVGVDLTKHELHTRITVHERTPMPWVHIDDLKSKLFNILDASYVVDGQRRIPVEDFFAVRKAIEEAVR